jgi:hypothetical protein
MEFVAFLIISSLPLIRSADLLIHCNHTVGPTTQSPDTWKCSQRYRTKGSWSDIYWYSIFTENNSYNILKFGTPTQNTLYILQNVKAGVGNDPIQLILHCAPGNLSLRSSSVCVVFVKVVFKSSAQKIVTWRQIGWTNRPQKTTNYSLPQNVT